MGDGDVSTALFSMAVSAMGRREREERARDLCLRGRRGLTTFNPKVVGTRSLALSRCEHIAALVGGCRLGPANHWEAGLCNEGL